MQALVHIALVVRDYDEAIEFYTRKLHFKLLEDTYQPEQDKRWVVVAPPGSNGTTILLARASKPEQEPFIGHQCGGRVFLFLGTDDFQRDYQDLLSQARPRRPTTALWRSSGTCMGTSGIWWNSSRAIPWPGGFGERGGPAAPGPLGGGLGGRGPAWKGL